MSKRVREKCRKLCIFSILQSKRGITPTKIDGNWRHSNLICSTVKFQLDISKHAGENCGKLHITYILSSQRGIHVTHSKIDTKWRRSNLIFSTLKKKSCAKFQLNISKHVWEKYGKRADGDPDGESDGRTETRTDGHHHTIIRPVWRRAYKIDDTRTWSNVYKKKVTCKISGQ